MKIYKSLKWIMKYQIYVLLQYKVTEKKIYN